MANKEREAEESEGQRNRQITSKRVVKKKKERNRQTARDREI